MTTAHPPSLLLTVLLPSPVPQVAAKRLLLPGRHVVLGRRSGQEPYGDPPQSRQLLDSAKVAIHPRWLGLSDDASVSSTVLRLAYADHRDGRALVLWHTQIATKNRRHFQFEGDGAAAPGMDPAADEGQIWIAPGDAADVRVSVFGHGGFQPRLVLRLSSRVDGPLRAAPHGTLPVPPPAAGVALVQQWLAPSRAVPDGVLTWQACLAVSAALACRTPEGELAAATSRHFGERGLVASAKNVQNAWNSAMKRLVDVLRSSPRYAPCVQWLGVQALPDYLDAAAAGQARVRLPSGEPEIRQLAPALEAVGPWL